MRAVSSIPIKRPMDFRFPGTGKISVTSTHTIGEGTKFLTEVKPNDYIVIYGNELRVSQVLSDSEITLFDTFEHSEKTLFKVYPRVDNVDCYEQVMKRIQNNECLLFFPEGETHETPGMIPLKGGIASLVIQSLEKDISIHLQCFTYVFSDPEKYQGKVQLVVGESFGFDKELVKLPKLQSYTIILDRILQVKSI